MQPKKGVVLLALGHPMYVNYALNLCVSLKFTSPGIKVTLIHSGNLSDLGAVEKFNFEKLIQCPESYYTTPQGGISYVQAKLYLDKLTPYDQTLFLDVDMIASPYKNIKTLFSQLEGKPFVIACRGKDSNTSDWVRPEEVKEEFGLAEYPDLSSEFMYFEKEGSTVFEQARIVNEDLPGRVWVRPFAAGIPDEPCFTIAMGQLGIEQYQVPFKPSYFSYVEPDQNSEQIWSGYYFLSMGGKEAKKSIVNMYSNIVKYYAMKTGISLKAGVSPTGAYLPKTILRDRKFV